MSLPGTSTKTFEHNATPEADYMFSLNRLFAFAVPGIVGSNQGSTNAFGSFGKAPLVQSTCVVPVSEYTRVGQLVPSMDGRVVTIRARVSNTRAKGKIAFLVLRHTFFTVQAVFSTGGDICKELIQFVGKINPESIVDLKGKVTVPPNPVAGTTQSHVELQGISIHLISEALPVLPFQLADAAAVETSSVAVNADTRLDARWLDNRTPANMGIFSLQSKLCQYFRDFLLQKCFQEIHTPKINVTATEGAGASVFKLDYFGKPAFLAQSPQLYKQMALQGDMEPGVFEVGPVFRSENANTHRHLTEFVGLDVEMILYNHYYEVLDLAEELFHSVFKNLQEKNADLIAHVATQFPHSPLVYAVPSDKIQKLGIGILEEDIASTDRYKAFVRNRACPSLRLNFEKAVELLGENLPENERVDPFEDLNTTNEKLLGRLVQERYGVDFYIVDEYPSAVRPFYTMPHPKNVKLSNSYDMFLRGEEISSGAQRIHDAQLLIDLCKQKGMDVAPINDYINCFRLGAWPHGGFGVGMERVVMLFLGLKNIRQTSLYPRDPRRVTP